MRSVIVIAVASALAFFAGCVNDPTVDQTTMTETSTETGSEVVVEDQTETSTDVSTSTGTVTSVSFNKQILREIEEIWKNAK